MSWVIVGLGNPGEEYDATRHNTGRMALDFFARTAELGEWKEDKKAKAHVASGLLHKNTVVLVAPDTFMNKSGAAVSKFVKSQKAAEKMIVVYDDLDLPLGSMKLSFDRGSGGHRGVESIAKAVKTKRFVRVRIGISPTTASGAPRKPQGEKVVNNFILSKFKPNDIVELKKIFKKAGEAITCTILEGREIAMNRFNTGA
jgi:PTH1 family peptidyl-tRNA hydrolase